MKIIRPMLFSLAVASVLSAAVPGMAAMTAAKPLTVTMTAQNGSGENGTATLTDVPGGVKVVVALTGAPATTPQPTHIHVGTCAHLNPAPKYPLSNTVDGNGTTTVKGVTIADLLKSPFAVNVHKSAAALGTYVSCGNITMK